MQFLKNTIDGEVRAVVAGEYEESERFAYWCNRDDERKHTNDDTVTIDGRRMIVGYLDHEEDEVWAEVRPSEIDQDMLAAIMFTMTSEFDTGDHVI